MNRRDFLKSFLAAAPTAVVAPKYFFAPVGGWRAQPSVDPRLFAYQKMLDDFCNRLTGVFEPPEQFWYCHPAQKAAIEELMPQRLWGLPYYVTKPPYISDEYLGISRKPYYGKSLVELIKKDAAPRANPRRGLMNAAS